MEPLTIFAASVGFTGMFHLIASTLSTVTKNRTAVKITRRSDWYCFFRMSDLKNANEKQDAGWNEADDANIEQRRRQQVQRSRLQA